MIEQTVLQFTELNLELNLEGELFDINGNIVLSSLGAFTPLSDPNAQPPFQPAVVPPSSFFANPKGQIVINARALFALTMCLTIAQQAMLTTYSLQTAVWALDIEGYFNKTITDSEIPSTSMIHLTTNNPFFLQIAPGLSDYPDMDINAVISLGTITDFNIASSVSQIATATELIVNFELTNSCVLAR
jgi:hypothetical protein